MEKGPVQLAKTGRSVTRVRLFPRARRTFPVRPAPSSGITRASASSWVETSCPVMVGISSVW